ncbi:hypothetical protein PPL_11069 [Heterostelium album PN500]|uniref:Ankyrin repeat protein n=1 Tax=Heterostelium pallidum (strain ATCC 26659 / Pp 5 / PN500) TaxID=670386 RepID=D3BSU9_HETP5|nr:hypothetical protein PPL_11069 [Heterostelium album PN500]EFA75564.1 hypothetical protein PPL_11069 [Heterostelium album PN500]|eukprot:XP_020427698.1 hypothetical protein PPL_11069 [Heterostelium album PN500]
MDKNLFLKLFNNIFKIKNIAKTGQLDAIQLLIESGFMKLDNGDMVHNIILKATKHGHIDILHFLISKNVKISRFHVEYIDFASSGGFLDIVQLLHENGNRCSKNAMDGAAAGGHLMLLRWLHENRTEGCSDQAMDLAANSNHFDFIKWIHENRSEGCGKTVMDMAAFHGNIDNVNWLYQNRTEGFSHMALIYASANVHFDIFLWLQDKLPEGTSDHQAIKDAYEWYENIYLY